MPSSTLDPDYLPESDRRLGRGHGTGALGPSDNSDSGSDIQGGIGFSDDLDIGLDRGTTSDPEESAAAGTAGPDLGDYDLDSDTDSGGTGERASAGRDTVVRDGQDIGTDRIIRVSDLSDDALNFDDEK
ncbi:MAG: hypothetical protein K0S28_970 [Paucimonas sp.]|jgi:hypothetical protein|nr:hypothetical protein [Paucimonas sp.]